MHKEDILPLILFCLIGAGLVWMILPEGRPTLAHDTFNVCQTCFARQLDYAREVIECNRRCPKEPSR